MGPGGVADLVAHHRHAAGLTQEDLAERSGVSARAISDMERGRVRRPQHRTLRALAGALGLHGDELVEFLRGGNSAQAAKAVVTVPTPRLESTPDELPPDVPDVTGRAHDLDRLLDAVEASPPGTPTVIGLNGPPGVGKTTLAVHAGHLLAQRFRHGSLFVDLRGTAAEPLTAEAALHRLLLALGVAEAGLPAGTEARAGLYRSMTRDRELLVLLDNVADEAQVRPLLPSGPGCLVLVTSRRVLTGLASVTRLPLSVFSPAESLELLRAVVGRRRIDAEPAAAVSAAELCGHLPLALRVVGNRLATRPLWRVEHLVAQLADQQRRLSALTAGDLRVRAAFEVSYRQCGEAARRALRRLSLIPGPDVTATLVSVLTEDHHDDVEAALEELVDASLLGTTTEPGRYVPHDLMWLFARERLAAEETQEWVDAARYRLTTWVLHAATRAGGLLSPPDTAPPHPRAHDDVAVDAASAVSWLDAEKTRWLAAVRRAARTERHAEVLEFATALRWYSEIRADGHVWREVFTYGVRAARTLGLDRDLAVQLNFLGWALNTIPGMQRHALRAHEEALYYARTTGDRGEEAWALQYCGRTELVNGDATLAVDSIREAIALFRELGDRFGEHSTLSILGMALHRLNRLPEAIAAHRATVAYFRTPRLRPHRNLLAVSLLRLADTLEAAGLSNEALPAFHESHALAITANYPLVEGFALFGIARCRTATGETHLARRLLEAALRVLTSIGEHWHGARVLSHLAALNDTLDPPRAAEERRRALEACRHLDTEDARTLARSLTNDLAIPPTPDQSGMEQRRIV